MPRSCPSRWLQAGSGNLLSVTLPRTWSTKALVPLALGSRCSLSGDLPVLGVYCMPTSVFPKLVQVLAIPGDFFKKTYILSRPRDYLSNRLTSCTGTPLQGAQYRTFDNWNVMVSRSHSEVQRPIRTLLLAIRRRFNFFPQRVSVSGSVDIYTVLGVWGFYL